jgi:hypothetical protein
MQSANTRDKKINWARVNQDNEAKLKSLKRLIVDWETQLPVHFYIMAINIINNKAG